MTNEADATQIFIAEAQDLQASIERNLLDLADTPGDKDLIDALFRELHTLKGSSAMFGFPELSHFVHEFETAFEALRQPDGVATPDLVSVALEASDHFLRLMDAPEDEAATSAQILDALQHALGVSAVAAEEPQSSDTQEENAESIVSSSWHIRFSLGEKALDLGINPFGVLDDLRALAPDEATVAVDLSQIGLLEDLDPHCPAASWTVTLPGTVSRADIDDAFLFVADDLDLDISGTDSASAADTAEATPAASTSAGPSEAAGSQETNVLQMTEDDDVSGAEKAALTIPSAETSEKTASGAKKAGSGTPNSMRVATERLDELMDRVGELVIAEARLNEISNQLGDGALLNVAEDIRRLSSGLRDTTMTIRMVPIGSLFGRFRRLVHDLSAKLDKPMDLVTTGGETELDKTVIEMLADPLVHIIRNSIDHGIETREIRSAKGKVEQGRIEIAASQAGAEVVISIRDDGCGLDLIKIRQRAVERGLIAEGNSLTEAEIRKLILEPGFSTRDEVTELSGRGVGMDVVQSTLQALRGQVEVDSEPGYGTEITLRLPLTLAIIDGLLIELGGERYTIPMDAIEECVELPAALALNGGTSDFLTVREGLVPFLRLADLFNVPGPRAEWQQVVIVGSAKGRVGLVVDRIITTNQTVIKQLSQLHTGLKNFSGATILGDGSVALILDVANLVAHGQRLEILARNAERVA